MFPVVVCRRKEAESVRQERAVPTSSWMQMFSHQGVALFECGLVGGSGSLGVGLACWPEDQGAALGLPSHHVSCHAPCQDDNGLSL